MKSRSRLAPWLAGVLAIISIGLYVVFIVLTLTIEHVSTNALDTGVPLDELPHLTAQTFAVLVGAFLAAKRPNSSIGWLLMLLGLGFLAYPVIVLLLASSTRSSGEPTVGLLLLAWTANWIWAIAFIGLVYTFLLFPNSQPLSPFWRLVGWLAAPVLGAVIISSALFPGPMQAAPQWENPLGLAIVAQLVVPLIGVMLIFELLSISALIIRFFRSRGIERQQLKWVAFGVAVLGIVNGINIGWNAFGGNLPMFDRLTRWLVGAGSIPVLAAMVIAVMRYRLYDIDIIIRRTLLYSILTLTLGLVYVGGILLGRALLASLTGSSDLAIVASTLAIAALFNPLRRYIQNAIDKRFYRRTYDAAKVLAAFAATARDETDLARLTDEMLRVVDETVQPAVVGLWLREPESN